MPHDENTPQGWSPRRRTDLTPLLGHQPDYEVHWGSHRRQSSFSSSDSVLSSAAPNQEVEAARAASFATLRHFLAAQQQQGPARIPNPESNVFATGSLIEALAEPSSVVRNGLSRPMGLRRLQVSASGFRRVGAAAPTPDLNREEEVVRAANFAALQGTLAAQQSYSSPPRLPEVARGRQPLKTVRQARDRRSATKRVRFQLDTESAPTPTPRSPGAQRRGHRKGHRQRRRASNTIYPVPYVPRIRGIYYSVGPGPMALPSASGGPERNPSGSNNERFHGTEASA